MHAGFQKVDPSLRKKLLNMYSMSLKEYWVDGRLQEEHIDKFIIQLGGSDDESSSESSSDESSSDEAFSAIITLIM